MTPSQTVKNFATHVMEKPSFPSFSSRIILEEFTKNKPLYPSIKSRKKRFYRDQGSDIKKLHIVNEK